MDRAHLRDSREAPVAQRGSVALELNDVVSESIFLLLIGPGLARPGQEDKPVRRRKCLRAIHGSLESAIGSPTCGFYRGLRSRTPTRRWLRNRSTGLQPRGTEAAGPCARGRSVERIRRICQ